MKKNTILLLMLFAILSLSAQYPFGGWSTVKIETNLPPNPIDKPAGGNLKGEWKPILFDDFILNPNFVSKVNRHKWNFGGLHDDGPCMANGYGMPDPQNIRAVENLDLQGDGLLRMDIIAQKHDSCQQFAGGMGADLMTFSTKDNFRSYWLYPDTYLELRVKQTFGFNAGVGIYLFPAWRPYLTEIDLCETILDPLFIKESKKWSGNANGKQDEYSNGYIWGESYKDPNFSCKNKVQIKDMQGKAVDMDGEWLIWGLEWHENVIRYYINNVLQKEMNLTTQPTCQIAHEQMYYKSQPMALRFTYGNVTSEKNKMPDSLIQSVYVDYIRAYQHADSQVIKPLVIPEKICDWGNGGGDNISVRYYPDVIYEWYSPAFDFEPKDMSILSHCFCEMQWMRSKPNLAWGKYPVYLKATLPDGRVENYTWQVEFGHEIPIMPTNISVEPIESSGYYQLIAQGDSNSLSYEWSLDSLEWKGTLKNNWQPFSGGQIVDVWVKSRVSCGFSSTYKQKTFIPNAPESAVFSENFDLTNPILGEKVVQEITVYNIMGSLIRRRVVLENDAWEGVLDGLISGVYVVLYRNKEGKIVALNKVYVSP